MHLSRQDIPVSVDSSCDASAAPGCCGSTCAFASIALTARRSALLVVRPSPSTRGSRDASPSSLFHERHVIFKQLRVQFALHSIIRSRNRPVTLPDNDIIPTWAHRRACPARAEAAARARVRGAVRPWLSLPHLTSASPPAGGVDCACGLALRPCRASRASWPRGPCLQTTRAPAQGSVCRKECVK